jgi:hypothetical protein
MEIATWNVERPTTTSNKNASIIGEIRNLNADILILTETHSIIRPPGYAYSLASDTLTADGENRTTIWSKYPLGDRIRTFAPETSVCVNVQTPHGGLYVYGTVIGVFGSREKSFLPDLELQIDDWARISKLGNICIAGDFNISWDSYYFTHDGRGKLSDAFKALKITNLTSEIPQNIDHVAISDSFLKAAKRNELPHTWNLEKKLRKPSLSDHIGVSVKLDSSDATACTFGEVPYTTSR